MTRSSGRHRRPGPRREAAAAHPRRQPPRADLDRLVEHLGLPALTADRPISATQLARRYPGIVPWAERHPVKLGCGVFLVVVGLIVVAVTF